MTVESSTPETAAARDALAHEMGYLDADWMLDILTRNGFTVVSGGEGLQHGDALVKVGTYRFHSTDQTLSSDTYRVASGAAPGTTAEPACTCPNVRGVKAWRCPTHGLAAGATAPETPVSWKERVGCGCSAGDGTNECERYDECYAAWHADTYPATAPETTPAACPDCGGHGVRVNPWATEQEALEGLNVAQCPSCGGSGVAETTP